MPTTRDLRRRATWRSLQRSAVELVGEHGMDGVTVEDITRHAGVSRRTFFNHFPTKTAALFDPDPDDSERLADLLAQAAAPGRALASAWEALGGVCVSFVAGHEDVIAVRRRLMAESPGLAQYHRGAHHHVEVALREWSRRLPVIDEFAADLLAQLAAGVLITAFEAWQPDQDPSIFPELVRRGFSMTSVDPAREMEQHG